MSTRWRRTVTAAVTALVIALVLPVSAYAAVAAKATASQRFTVLTWTAVAAAPGGAAGSGSLTVALDVTDKKNRSGVFDIVNTGTSPLSGLTIVASASGLATGGSTTFTSCSTAWTVSANGKTHTCGGTKTTLGSISGASGSKAVTVSLAAGARVSVNCTATAPDDKTATSQTISIKVARSQAAAKRNR